MQYNTIIGNILMCDIQKYTSTSIISNYNSSREAGLIKTYVYLVKSALERIPIKDDTVAEN